MRLSDWSRRTTAADGEIIPPDDVNFADDLSTARSNSTRADIAMARIDRRASALRRLHAGNARLFRLILGGVSLFLIPPLLILAAIFGAILIWALWDMASILFR